MFFAILETKDINLLCTHGKVKDLDSIWEGIVKEYEELTSSDEYISTLNRNNKNLISVLRVNGLINLYYLVTLDPEGDYSEFFKLWGVNGTTKEAVENAIKQERTKFEINLVKNSAMASMKDIKPMSFEEVKATIELALGKNYIDPNVVTVKEWVYYCKLAQTKATSITKLAHERKNNTQ